MPSMQPSTISGSPSEPITIYHEILNTAVPDKSKEPYNYGKIYKLLLKNHSNILDYNNPKLLAESIAYQIHWDLDLPIKYCKKWVYEYQYRSKYSDLYQIGNNKYNLDGTYEGILTQADIDKTMQELHDNVGVFSDPILDPGFKKLFANTSNLTPLINILNALLKFEGDNAIKTITINKHDVNQQSEWGIQSAVDVRCTTEDNKKITVEMQSSYKQYFLSRSQYYMSERIVEQMQSGSGDMYHKAIYPTYVISIGRENFFQAKDHLQDPTSYVTIEKPMIIGRGSDGKEIGVQEAPHNKMVWYYFELAKFAKMYENKLIDINSTEEEQWLNFLLKCADSKCIPESASEEIQEAYNIMEVQKFTPQEALVYSRYKFEQAMDELERKEDLEAAKQEEREEQQQKFAEQQQKFIEERIESDNKRMKIEHDFEEALAQAAQKQIKALETVAKLTQDIDVLVDASGFTHEQVKTLLLDKDNLQENASHILGFDHNLFDDTEEVQNTGETNPLSAASDLG